MLRGSWETTENGERVLVKAVNKTKKKRGKEEGFRAMDGKMKGMWRRTDERRSFDEEERGAMRKEGRKEARRDGRRCGGEWRKEEELREVRGTR